MTKPFATNAYLPDERPPLGRLLLYALQQVVVMFPATVLVALITGFQVSTTIFASGLATVCFTFITGGKIPMYYGSSFAYLTAIASMKAGELTYHQLMVANNGILPPEFISVAQFGIIFSGLVSIAAGLLVKWGGTGKGGKDSARPGHRPCGHDYRPHPGRQRHDGRGAPAAR